jgi:F-type H+-transporting ATPase subunit b
MLNEQIHDPHFWVLLSTILFVVLAYKKGKKPVLAMLDGRTAYIKAELEEAERLRAEAQEILADGQRKHRDAIHTAQKIIDNAKEAACNFEKEAGQKLTDTLERREIQLLDRIARAEAEAVQALRTQAADLASRAAEKLLQESLSKAGGGKLVDDAILDLSGSLN